MDRYTISYIFYSIAVVFYYDVIFSKFSIKNCRTAKKIDCGNLASSHDDLQTMYHECLNDKLLTVEDQYSHPNGNFKSVLSAVWDAGVEVLGYKLPQKKKNHTNDPVIKSLSIERHKLLLDLNNNNTSLDRSVAPLGVIKLMC